MEVENEIVVYPTPDFTFEVSDGKVSDAMRQRLKTHIMRWARRRYNMTPTHFQADKE